MPNLFERRTFLKLFVLLVLMQFAFVQAEHSLQAGCADWQVDMHPKLSKYLEVKQETLDDCRLKLEITNKTGPEVDGEGNLIDGGARLIGYQGFSFELQVTSGNDAYLIEAEEGVPSDLANMVIPGENIFYITLDDGDTDMALQIVPKVSGRSYGLDLSAYIFSQAVDLLAGVDIALCAGPALFSGHELFIAWYVQEQENGQIHHPRTSWAEFAEDLDRWLAEDFEGWLAEAVADASVSCSSAIAEQLVAIAVTGAERTLLKYRLLILAGVYDLNRMDFENVEYLTSGPLAITVRSIGSGDITYLHNGAIYQTDLGSEPSILFSNPDVEYSDFRWSPDGRSIYAFHAPVEGEYSPGRNFDIVNTLSKRVVYSGNVVENVHGYSSDPNLDITWSPDGTLFVYNQNNYPNDNTALLVNDRGEVVKEFVKELKTPFWSHDSKHLYYIGNFQPGESFADLYAYDVLLDTISKVETYPDEFRYACAVFYSPISSWIAFKSNCTDGFANLVFANLNGDTRFLDQGAGYLTALVPDELVQFPAFWSANGNQFVYPVDLYGEADIYKYDVSLNQEILLVEEAGSNPRWSPDGKWIAYTTTKGGLNLLDQQQGNGSTEPISLLPNAPDYALTEQSFVFVGAQGYLVSSPYMIPQWSADSRYILFPYPKEVYRYSLPEETRESGGFYVVDTLNTEAIWFETGEKPQWRPQPSAITPTAASPIAEPTAVPETSSGPLVYDTGFFETNKTQLLPSIGQDIFNFNYLFDSNSYRIYDNGLSILMKPTNAATTTVEEVELQYFFFEDPAEAQKLFQDRKESRTNASPLAGVGDQAAALATDFTQSDHYTYHVIFQRGNFFVEIRGKTWSQSIDVDPGDVIAIAEIIDRNIESLPSITP